MTNQSNVNQVNRELLRYLGRSLKSDTSKPPWLHIRGVFAGWDVVMAEDFNKNMVNFIRFDFKNVQVLALRDEAEPYLQDTASFSVKVTDSERSGMGFLIKSWAKAAGIDMSETDFDAWIDKPWEVEIQNYDWGTNRSTGERMVGEIYQIHPVANQVVTSPSVAQVHPVENQSAPVSAPATLPNTANAASVTPEPVQSVLEGANGPATTTNNAEAEALTLLHGRTMNEFLPLAVTNDTIKSDMAFMQTAMTAQWQAGLIASGKVILDPVTQRYSVVGMDLPF